MFPLESTEIGAMKQIMLSDHTGDQKLQAKQQREDDYAARMAAYRLDVDRKRQSIEEAKERMRDTWRDRRILVLVISALQAAWRSLFGWPSEPEMQEQTREEHIWSAGGDGETKVAEFLARQLDDAWTLVSGYRNGRGEIDQILIGPTGLFTIEVKNINGTLTIDGDHWISDKYDRYGNLKKQGTIIADKGGRSPSRQLNESTDRMLEFLRKSLPSIAAVRIVVLSHERSVINRVSNPTVTPVALHAWPLSSTLSVDGVLLSDIEQSRVIELLQRDHAYHQKRREQRRPAPAADGTGGLPNR